MAEVNGYKQIAEYRNRIAENGEIVFSREIMPGRADGNPLVSVITQTLNSAATIATALENVRKQTYPNIEHIIVDGLSGDDTLEQLLRNKDWLAKILRGKDRSPADACNKGVAVCRGDLVCIMPSDDFFEPRYVENAVAALWRKKCDFVFGDLIYTENGRQALLIPGDPDYARTIRYRMPSMSTISLMHRRSAFDRVGLWDADNRYCPDYDWLLRAHLAGLTGGYDPSIRAWFSHGGISSSNYFAALRRVRDVAIQHGGPAFLAHRSYWRGVAQKIIRDALRSVLPAPVFHGVLRHLTRTRTRPFDELTPCSH